MSVQTFVESLYDSDLDFSNVSVDDFVMCVKRLAKILDTASSDSRKSVRERKMNSLLSRRVFNSERFDPKRVYDYYSFTYENEQIDICIKGHTYCVSVIGDFVPDAKSVMDFVNFYNESYTTLFDFADIEYFSWKDSKFTYYGGSSEYFPVSEIGLRHIARVWSAIVQMFLQSLTKSLYVQ